MAYRSGAILPTTSAEVVYVPQKDRTDWLAYVLMFLIFVALFAGVTAIGAGSKLPFLD